MLVAIAVTFARSGLTSYWVIALGMLIGGGFGAVAARRVKMTAMPQMVALFNGVGGGAAALVSLAELHRLLPEPGTPKVDIGLAIVLSALIGSISFAGSMIAFAKLQELIGGRPITYAGQQFVNAALFPRARLRESPSSPASSTNGCCGRSSEVPRSSESCSCCRSAAPTCRS
jgi:NAD(P) transhydrogenase subunit beta